jgi:hypothetical protein
MRRFIETAVAVLVAATTLAVGGSGTAQAAPCTGTVQITSLAFAPATVAPGQSSTATLVAQNCTDQTQATSTVWFGRFLSSSGAAFPPGCPAIDPVALPATFPPGGQASRSLSYLALASCTATDLQLTVRITSSTDGSTLAEQTADLAIAARPQCSVSYLRQTEWPGGFVAGVTLTNSGASTVDGWTLAFTFPGDQQITNSWSGTAHQAGQSVTVTNTPWNRLIAPGSSAWTGFIGTWHTSDASPTAFTLNDLPCTTT